MIFVFCFLKSFFVPCLILVLIYGPLEKLLYVFGWVYRLQREQDYAELLELLVLT